MAVATNDFFIKASDGWVLVADTVTFLHVKPSARKSWALAITASGAPAAAVRATGTVTFSGLPSNGETATVGDDTYTFVAALTGGTGDPYEVLIGADATATGDNLEAAINGDAGAGTTYGTGTVANAQATASNAAGVVTITARGASESGNDIVLAENAANTAVSGATLTGGADAIRGISFLAGAQDNTPNEFRADSGIAGEVYVRVLVDDGPGPLHFGVLTDAV